MASRIPRLVSGFRLDTLSIEPRQVFVLVRIEGTLTVAEIAESIGQDPAEVERTIESLVGLGVVAWSELPARSAPPEEPEEAVDIDPARRQKVLDTYRNLGKLDYYQLLGVSRDATKQEVRSAYFQLSKVFHPDTLFGKELGSFKHKMEVVFRHLTEAYDVLGRKRRREAYDGYLQARDATGAAQQSLEQGRREAAEMLEATFASPSAPPRAPSIRPDSEEALRLRRERAARRIAAVTGRAVPRSSAPPRAPSGAKASSEKPSARPTAPLPSSSPPAPVTREHVLRGLANSLRGAAAARRRPDRIERYLADAREAEGRGDLVGATNALRLALTMAKDRPDLIEEYERVSGHLAQSLATTYAKQAAYEEENKQWARAALSWARVSDGCPRDPEPASRAALALLEARGDVKRARILAQKAVDLAPSSGRARAVLGKVLLQAGMESSARKQIERAIELDPQDELVKTLKSELKN